MNTTLHYTLSFDDFVEFQKVHRKLARRTGAARWSRRIMLGGILFLTVFLLIFVLFRDERPASSLPPRAPATAPGASPVAERWVSVVPWILIFVVLWYFFFRTMRGQVRHAWKANANDLQQPGTIEITPDYLRVCTPDTTTEHKWRGLRRLTEGPTIFAIYTSATTAHIIPKRAFASPADVDAFRLLAQSLIIEPTGGFPVLPSASSDRIAPSQSHPPRP